MVDITKINLKLMFYGTTLILTHEVSDGWKIPLYVQCQTKGPLDGG